MKDGKDNGEITLQGKNSKPYHKIKDGNVYACDVDDTIVMWSKPDGHDGDLVTIRTNGFEEQCIPNTYVIEHIKKMKRRHYTVVIWSAGGSEWAESVVNSLGLDEYVDLIMPKIDEHMDDVRDPSDKIGRWSYIYPDGTAVREGLDGKTKTWKLNGGETYAEETKKGSGTD